MGAFRPLRERFWEKVKKGKGRACWVWTAGTDEHGYGQIGTEGGRQRRAHRVSYELHHGVYLFPSQHVLHHCDNPPCVRPSHLHLGNAQRNMDDKVSRHRQRNGITTWPEHHAAKLTPTLVRIIRSSGDPSRQLAARFGVAKFTIDSVRRRLTWKYVK